MELQERVVDFFMGRDIQNKLLIKEWKVTYSILVGYVLFVKWIGPALMRNLKPMDLRITIRVYNFFQVTCNTAILYYLVSLAIRIWPNKCLTIRHPQYSIWFQESAVLTWHLFLLKLSDLIDTVFFVLRKKNSHISILHVFHHAGMVLLFHTGIITRYVGYYILLGICINTFIHSIMYTYYFLATFGPKMQKYLWWKRYLTQMQIIQFVTILIYMTWAFITNCEELVLFNISIYCFIVLILVLFLNFYIKSFKSQNQNQYKPLVN